MVASHNRKVSKMSTLKEIIAGTELKPWRTTAQWLLASLCSASFLIQPGPVCLGIVLPSVDPSTAIINQNNLSYTCLQISLIKPPGMSSS